MVDEKIIIKKLEYIKGIFKDISNEYPRKYISASVGVPFLLDKIIEYINDLAATQNDINICVWTGLECIKYNPGACANRIQKLDDKEQENGYK